MNGILLAIPGCLPISSKEELKHKTTLNGDYLFNGLNQTQAIKPVS